MTPTSVAEVFLQAAANHGPEVAVDHEGVQTSYAELAALAGSFSRAVRARSSGPAKVAILLPQGAAAYACMFGTLMSGGYYCPMNVEAPAAQIARVLDLFDPDIIVTGQPELAAGSRAAVLPPPGGGEDGATAMAEGPEPVPPHDLAYVIFTSGSTGLPKGVMIPQEALLHYIGWSREALGLSPQDRCSQHPRISFDLSVLDVFAVLCSGAALCPLTSSMDRLLPALSIKRLGLTVWNSVPSVIDLMSKANQMTAENLATLRLMTFCGEPLLKTHLEAIFGARPDIRVQNTYGPTEATVSCTEVSIGGDDIERVTNPTVALGTAIDGMGLHLLGGPHADEGEIVLTGPQLARGYWGDEQATDAAFRNVDIDGRTRRAYVTGDWAERVDGQLYFRNRIDAQIKINGYRVELDEIDNAIRDIGVTAACCTVFSGNQLHSFIEADEENNLTLDQLREALAEKVEPYKIPGELHVIPEIPRNASDKLDRRALVARYLEP